MRESLLFDSNGASRFRSRSNQDYERQTVTAVKAIMPNFDGIFRKDQECKVINLNFTCDQKKREILL